MLYGIMTYYDTVPALKPQEYSLAVGDASSSLADRSVELPAVLPLVWACFSCIFNVMEELPNALGQATLRN